MAVSCLDDDIFTRLSALETITIYDDQQTRSMAECYLLAVGLCDNLRSAPIDGFEIGTPNTSHVVGLFQKNISSAYGFIIYFPCFGREVIDISLCDANGIDIVNEMLGYGVSKQVKTVADVRAEIQRVACIIDRVFWAFSNYIKKRIKHIFPCSVLRTITRTKF